MRGTRGRLLLGGLVVTLGVMGVSCGDEDASGVVDECGSGDTIVEVRDNVFDPESIEITRGTTVCWPNEGRVEHNVLPDEGDRFGVDSIDPGEAYVYTFEEPGTYDYYCSFHGAPGRGQIGQVIVDGSDSASSTTTSSPSTSTSTSTISSTSGSTPNDTIDNED